MTREGVIEVIKAYRDKLTNSASNQLDGDIEAFDMAIKALEQEPKTGHWTTIEMTQDDGCRYTVTYCSECDEDVDYRTDYCPNCGCRMVQEGSDKE